MSQRGQRTSFKPFLRPFLRSGSRSSVLQCSNALNSLPAAAGKELRSSEFRFDLILHFLRGPDGALEYHLPAGACLLTAAKRRVALGPLRPGTAPHILPSDRHFLFLRDSCRDHKAAYRSAQPRPQLDCRIGRWLEGKSLHQPQSVHSEMPSAGHCRLSKRNFGFVDFSPPR